MCDREIYLREYDDDDLTCINCGSVIVAGYCDCDGGGER